MDGVPFLFNYSFRGLHSPDPFPESIPGLHSRAPFPDSIPGLQGQENKNPDSVNCRGFMCI